MLCDVKDLLRLDLLGVDMFFHQGVSSSPMYRENPQLVADAVVGRFCFCSLYLSLPQLQSSTRLPCFSFKVFCIKRLFHLVDTR